MTDWQKIREDDCAVPAGVSLDDLVDRLSLALRDPDPEVRDGAPYGVLMTWIRRGVIDAPRRSALGDEMAARFADPEIQARTFAPLVLDMIVTHGGFSPAWVDAFARWYPAETDLRGHDPVVGWLHAVAHGADLLGRFGLCPEVAPTRMLDLAAARLLARTDHVFAEQEDDRLAQAVALTLTRPELTEAESLGWLTPVRQDFAALGGGPTPAHASNSMRTLRMLYLLADRGVRTSAGAEPAELVHREALKEGLADVLQVVFQHA
ncbi:DUF2785 domain-containing protein [Streptomyces sp. NPDC051219]|uniref:DUF2785 domain-containing protein n=1 Tax=Streptomyces sp. NPDC051219 TaxID=3155283 RepID=UPI003425CC1E